jgi:hypothetical protein
MIRLAAVLALCLASGAQGQELSPDDFQARTEGRAFGTYFMDGTLLGIEIFLNDRQVIWQDASGTCQKGHWQVDNGHVCYHYEFSGLGHCMIYRAEGDAIIGRADYGDDYILRQRPKEDVTCPTDQPLMSMDADRGEIVLAREVERKLAVGDQRKLAAVRPVD